MLLVDLGKPLGRRDIGFRKGWVQDVGPGDFPVKQAFLAFLQADTIAEHIGAQVSYRAVS